MQITPAKDGKPVQIELIDAKTKEPKETLEVMCRKLSYGKSGHGTPSYIYIYFPSAPYIGFVQFDTEKHVLQIKLDCYQYKYQIFIQLGKRENKVKLYAVTPFFLSEILNPPCLPISLLCFIVFSCCMSKFVCSIIVFSICFDYRF